MIRAIFDSNIVVSALLFPSENFRLLKTHWAQRTVIPVVCREMVLELYRVLAYPKFALTEQDIDALLLEYLPYVETISSTEASLLVCEDPKDQIFLDLAHTVGGQVVLVSGDRDLLSLASEATFPIQTFAEFWRSL